MHYVDSQRTITRRDSSLITTKRFNKDDGETLSASVPFTSESLVSMGPRPKCSVQAELVTMMFESMLEHIVESWTPIVPQKRSESYYNMDLGKTCSDVILVPGSKKKKPVVKASKTKRSRSKFGLATDAQDSQQLSWWSAPDEKAIICFRNGNLYEGNISMKCMHGEGRFQWADGTVYLGQFKDNEINGKGLIQWKDDTWYEGEFAGNLRHGHGLYVDSRRQRSYMGGWYCGAKHGEGIIYYTRTFHNSYDGEWIQNERFGYGSREYCPASGYKGEWERNIREGKGLMIWPNNDCYRGGWKNGVMSGYGIYLWDSYYNNSMSVPSLKAYRGYWVKGLRDGFGKLSLGLGLGAYYKGEFKKNKKDGNGKFVTINGLILQDKNLFIDDSLGPLREDEHSLRNNHHKRNNVEPLQFDICDSTVGLLYHIDEALNNIDKRQEVIINIINDYIQNNKLNISLEETTQTHVISMDHKSEQQDSHGLEKLKHTEPNHLQDLIIFEEISLRKALQCYETHLRNIYYKYATICNSEEITFTPVMIRLYLWQLYNDCNIHKKGLTLHDIDKIFYRNREWMARSPHDPFEKIYFWQFLHSLISVASKLYAKKYLPGPKPDTILASGFRIFMEEDVLPGANQRKGHLVNGYGTIIPLKATYALYQSLGEPHTIRMFLRAVRRSPHFQNRPQPPMADAPEECLPIGRNCFIFGDDMSFTVDYNLPEPHETINTFDLNLFNFANLSNKTIIKIFAKIFPQVLEGDKIMNLNIKLTFFEFFEALIECCLESIRVKEEEIKWRTKFSGLEITPAPHSTPTGYLGKYKYVD